ncbi:MAG: alpha/beta hydrolase [Chloroflexota bacterium]|nr:alpha/beta hydrolase [Chloroflexota bacterium]MDE2682779.1 alpha/beta hydrolase [Chloroflexota bacterium]
MKHARDLYINLRGLPFHYRDWGGDGRPVLLLHGLASTCHIWDLVAPLLAADFRVAALDQRGHGQSAQVDNGYDFATVLGDAAAFIEHLGWERPIVVGHSWGADVALELAVAKPERVTGLIFVDGGTIDISSRPGWTLAQAREEMAPPIFTGFTPQMMRERVESSGRFGPDAPPETTEAVLANFRVLDDGTIQSNLRRENHLRIIDALWDHKPGDLYPRLKCATLMLPARQATPDAMDRRFRREESIARAESLLSCSKTVWLEDSIHDVPLQRPTLVADTIREHIQNGFFD